MKILNRTMKKNIWLVLAVFFCVFFTPVYAEEAGQNYMEGLCLEKISAGKKIYALEADKAVLTNKRVGFFNFGFMKVIELHNVSLKLYDNGKLAKEEHFTEAVYDLSTKSLLDRSGHVVFEEKPGDAWKEAIGAPLLLSR